MARPLGNSVYFNSPEAKAVLQWSKEQAEQQHLSWTAYMVKLVSDEYERQNGTGSAREGGAPRLEVLLEQVLARLEGGEVVQQPIDAVATQTIDHTPLDGLTGGVTW